MNEKRKCSKCGSSELTIRKLNIPGNHGWFNYLSVQAYVCKNCHHVEFFEA